MQRVNPLLHDNTFWHFWNTMYWKILWKIDHFLSLEQMLHFPEYFQKYSKLYLIFFFFFFFFQFCLKIENDVMIYK